MPEFLKRWGDELRAKYPEGLPQDEFGMPKPIPPPTCTIKMDRTLTPEPVEIVVSPQPIKKLLHSDPELEACMREMRAGGLYQERVKEYAKRLVRRDSILLETDATVTEGKAAARPELPRADAARLREEVPPNPLTPQDSGWSVREIMDVYPAAKTRKQVGQRMKQYDYWIRVGKRGADGKKQRDVKVWVEADVVAEYGSTEEKLNRN